MFPVALLSGSISEQKAEVEEQKAEVEEQKAHAGLWGSMVFLTLNWLW